MELIKLKSLEVMLDSNSSSVCLDIFDCINDKWCTTRIPRDQFNAKKLERVICENNCVCDNVKNTVTFLQRQMSQRLLNKDDTFVKRIHKNYGFLRIHDTLYFEADRVFREDTVLDSTYVGDFDITQQGELKDFQEFYKDVLADNIPMQGILCMGAGATVLVYANMAWGYAFNNAINHIVGNSSMGKTTAAMLFTSMGCNPRLDSDNALFLSFLATKNALIKRIGSCSGYPVAIDEFSTTSRKKEWSDFVYTLANGREKERTQGGGAVLQKANTFSTVFLTTGESSLLSKCNENDGIRTRLFEFGDVEWTRSAEESDKIKEFCLNHYGLLTPLVAQELMKMSDYWHSRLRYWQQNIKLRVSDDKLHVAMLDRLVGFIAIYMVGAEILAKVCKLTLKTEGIVDFFYDIIVVGAAQQKTVGRRAYRILSEYFFKNRDKFVFIDVKSGAPILQEGQEGYYCECGRPHEVNGKEYNEFFALPIETVEDILSSRGFTNIRTALRGIKDEGLLKSKDKKHLSTGVLCNGGSISMYLFYIFRDEMRLGLLDYEEEDSSCVNDTPLILV